jgi:hypothetical protein
MVVLLCNAGGIGRSWKVATSILPAFLVLFRLISDSCCRQKSERLIVVTITAENINKSGAVCQRRARADIPCACQIHMRCCVMLKI